MSQHLEQCSACHGFLRASASIASTCPHCGVTAHGGVAKKRTAVGVALGALGGASVAFTLMACYGGPPQLVCPDGSRDCTKPTPAERGTTGTSAYPGHSIYSADAGRSDR